MNFKLYRSNIYGYVSGYEARKVDTTSMARDSLSCKGSPELSSRFFVINNVRSLFVLSSIDHHSQATRTIFWGQNPEDGVTLHDSDVAWCKQGFEYYAIYRKKEYNA